MKIGRPEISHTGGEMVIRYPVELAGSCRSLWYSLDEQNAHLVDPGFEGPLAGLLIPAMAAGEEIRVEGDVCQKQVYNLQHQLQPLLKAMLPGLSSVQIRPDGVREIHTEARGIISGFSAGVDSFITLQDYYLSPEIEDHSRLTHLAFFNVGSNGTDAGGEQMFHLRVKSLRKITEALQLPLVVVNSNLSEFYAQGLPSFEYNHTLRSASAALLLQRGMKRFLYSAGYGYPEVFIRPKMLIAHVDPIILPQLSTAAMDLISSGSEYQRVDKVRRITEIPLTYEHLNVCLKSHENCSRCRKCIRTQLILDLLGKLDLYKNIFNLDDYYARRRSYIYKLFYYDNPFVREIFHLAWSSKRAPLYMKVLMLLRGKK
jgi:hypothetical protein